MGERHHREAGNLDWVDDANCANVNTDIFFPTKGDYATMQLAKSICANCLVVDECLDYALKTNATGIYGGTSERERRNIRRERRIIARPDIQ